MDISPAQRPDPFLSDLPGDVKTVFSRKHHIQDHHVINPGFYGVLAFHPIPPVVYLIIFLPQYLTQSLIHPLFIFYK